LAYFYFYLSCLESLECQVDRCVPWVFGILAFGYLKGQCGYFIVLSIICEKVEKYLLYGKNWKMSLVPKSENESYIYGVDYQGRVWFVNSGGGGKGSRLCWGQLPNSSRISLKVVGSYQVLPTISLF